MQPKKFSEYTPITNTDGSEVIPILKAGVNTTVKSEDLPISTATQTAIDAADADIAAHVADAANPHQVTKAQVGLGNADNTSDANKPISTAQATAIALKADQSTTYTKTEVDTKDTDVADTAQTNLTAHTSNTSNPHSTTKAQVGLGNADNTSDVDKPISTATQTALDAKATNTALSAHTNNTSNPHSVTKSQVGLGSVDNTSDINKPVSTAQATADAAVASTAAANLSAHTTNTSNPHSVTKSQVGLGNADNTSDVNKPVSTATTTQLNLKENLSNKSTTTTLGTSDTLYPSQKAVKTYADTADALKFDKTGGLITGATTISATGSSTPLDVGSDVTVVYQRLRNNTTNTNQGLQNFYEMMHKKQDGTTVASASIQDFFSGASGSEAATVALRAYRGGANSPFLSFQGSANTIFTETGTKLAINGASGPQYLTGTGFPNGVVTAPVGSIYIDTAVTNGASSWIKKSGTGNTGWKILEGDTGQRDITATLANGWTATKVFVRRVNNEVYLQVDGLNAAAMTNTIFATLSAGLRGYSNTYASRMMLHTAAGPVAAWRANIEAGGGVYVGNSTTATPVLYGLAPFPTLDDWPTTLPGIAA